MDRADRVEPAAAQQNLLEIRPLDVLHHDEQPALILARVVDRDHVRVIDLAGDLELALEPLPERVVLREPVGHHLDRNLAVERQLDGAPHDRHSALSGNRLEPTAADHRFRSQRGCHPD